MQNQNSTTEVKTQQQLKIESVVNYRKNAKLEEYHDIKIITYLTSVRGVERPGMMIFQGKQKMPYSHYYYNELERRATMLQRAKDNADTRAKEKAEKKAFVPQFEVGEIFNTSWGYDQTNVDFFQVIKKVGKSTALLREVKGEYVGERGDMSGHVMPLKDQFLNEKILKKRCGQYGFKIHSSATASKHDGTPCYTSSYA